MIAIIQGESFPIPVILQKGSQKLGPSDVEDVQICVAGIRQKKSDGTLEFDAAKEFWKFFPSQEDTLSAPVGMHTMQTQIKYPNGEIRKVVGPFVNIQECPCKEPI